MNKKIWTAIGAGALFAATTLPALALTEQGVTATVTPGVISVAVSPTPVGYGIVGVPSVDNLLVTPGADQIIKAENTGGIPETFNIKGANAMGATVDWTIVTGSPGGASTFDYNHKFLNCGNSDSACSTVDAANTMGTTYETLEINVGAGSSDYFKLNLSTPTETGGDTSIHSTTVTVQAVAF